MNTKYCQLKIESGSFNKPRDCFDNDKFQMLLEPEGHEICFRCVESRGCSALGELKKDGVICICKSDHCNQNCNFDNCHNGTVNGETYQQCKGNCTPGNLADLPTETGTKSILHFFSMLFYYLRHCY